MSYVGLSMDVDELGYGIDINQYYKYVERLQKVASISSAGLRAVHKGATVKPAAVIPASDDLEGAIKRMEFRIKRRKENKNIFSRSKLRQKAANLTSSRWFLRGPSKSSSAPVLAPSVAKPKIKIDSPLNSIFAKLSKPRSVPQSPFARNQPPLLRQNGFKRILSGLKKSISLSTLERKLTEKTIDFQSWAVPSVKKSLQSPQHTPVNTTVKEEISVNPQTDGSTSYEVGSPLPYSDNRPLQGQGIALEQYLAELSLSDSGTEKEEVGEHEKSYQILSESAAIERPSATVATGSRNQISDPNSVISRYNSYLSDFENPET